jgi:antirestriction protein ArdC
MKARFGSAAHAMEELRAESSSAFIAGELGISADMPQHASYIADWLRKLKDDEQDILGLPQTPNESLIWCSRFIQTLPLNPDDK